MQVPPKAALVFSRHIGPKDSDIFIPRYLQKVSTTGSAWPTGSTPPEPLSANTQAKRDVRAL